MVELGRENLRLPMFPAGYDVAGGALAAAESRALKVRIEDSQVLEYLCVFYWKRGEVALVFP